MKMNVEALADLIIHSFLRGVEHKEDLSDIEDALDEHYLFRPVEGEDGDWDYTGNDEA